MGEAKRRGSFEQRLAEAIAEREKQEALRKQREERNRIAVWKPGTPRSKHSLVASEAIALALASLNTGR